MRGGAADRESIMGTRCYCLAFVALFAGSPANAFHEIQGWEQKPRLTLKERRWIQRNPEQAEELRNSPEWATNPYGVRQNVHWDNPPGDRERHQQEYDALSPEARTAVDAERDHLESTVGRDFNARYGGTSQTTNRGTELRNPRSRKTVRRDNARYGGTSQTTNRATELRNPRSRKTVRRDNAR